MRFQWMFYGYLLGYLISIYGHRCGVFQNLLIQEVVESRCSPDGSAVVINVTSPDPHPRAGVNLDPMV